jgi:GINS complex subunit 4
MAPELLPYQHALVESICREINAKDREITQRMENKKQSGQDERFYLNINRMEIERTKYTLKSYLRCRMIKIEKHLLYIVEKDQAHLLSPSEMEYAWTLYEAKKEHFNSEFFEKVSKKLNCMDEGQDI